MKCHAGVEFDSGRPCPKCNAKLGEVCWPGINADLLEVVRLRHENERLRAALAPFAGEKMPSLRRSEIDFDRYGLRRSISPMEIACRDAYRALSPAQSGGARE